MAGGFFFFFILLFLKQYYRAKVLQKEIICNKEKITVIYRQSPLLMSHDACGFSLYKANLRNTENEDN